MQLGFSSNLLHNERFRRLLHQRIVRCGPLTLWGKRNKLWSTTISQLLTLGFDSQLLTLGFDSQLLTLGFDSQLLTLGFDSQLLTLGFDSQLLTLGFDSQLLTLGFDSQLLTLGFDSQEALALLTSDDLSKSKMPVGQMKLLLKAIQQTFSSTVTVQTAPTTQTPATAPVPEGDQIQTAEPEDPFVQEVLNQLGAAQLAERGVAAPSRNPQTLWQDPQIYLKALVTPKAQSVHHDIEDFVNVLGAAMSEEYISCKANGQLVYKLDRQTEARGHIPKSVVGSEPSNPLQTVRGRGFRA